MAMPRVDRLRDQVSKLRHKVHTVNDSERKKLLLRELVGVLTALERVESPLGSAGRTSNKVHRRKVAARHAEVERDFANALARYAPRSSASRSVSSSPTTATV